MEKVLSKPVNEEKINNKKLVSIIETIIIGILTFLVPTFMGQLIKSTIGEQTVLINTLNTTQLITGSIVNTLLILSALNLKGWKQIIPVVTMPSISTILSGYVFKSASPFMCYMIPFIWIGNFALIYAFKYITLNKNKAYPLSAIVGIITKVLIIFASFEILKAFNVFPAKIVSNLETAMGLTQLITASIGSIIGYGIYKVEKTKINKNK